MNSIVQGLLTGGAGAAAGAMTSSGGNTTVDVVNSTTSAMAQSRPEVKDPDVVAAEAAQDPIRKQNLLNNSHAAITVVTNQDNYSSDGAFMTALYQALNPSDKSEHTITQAQANKVKEVIANKSNYSSDNDYANALNNAFRNVSK
ncbi:hypothetical protein [Commensalibacter papalotli (ex Servin-Garciduenas et al. 2014)]|uniref:Uncharacterized protein n=2 Tax=Commensalibacter TaxID=1079922 RepID=W7E3U5_9PROT|nr:hypothetical protein [Commensalibacter papalotli (ex Servin-Garciduenas et al. 2014)]EUK17711.1 hypothetical protein COMX_09636 [Commensalibacter papalotli (ex Servin-Garciduenas et al. 2014)]